MPQMVSLDPFSPPHVPLSLPLNSRFSFSFDQIFEENLMCIDQRIGMEPEEEEFEFHSGNLVDMITADELFREGKMLPSNFQMYHSQQVKKTLKNPERGPSLQSMGVHERNHEIPIKWFFDDNPSPRPPKCSVLWKELWRLRKSPSNLRQSLSSSSSLSSSVGSSSSSSSRKSLDEIPLTEHKRGGVRSQEKGVRKNKKEGAERISSNVRLIPVSNVPIRVGHQRKNSIPIPWMYNLRHV